MRLLSYTSGVSVLRAKELCDCLHDQAHSEMLEVVTFMFCVFYLPQLTNKRGDLKPPGTPALVRFPTLTLPDPAGGPGQESGLCSVRRHGQRNQRD